MHWNNQFTSAGCIDRVVNPASDPISGEPEFKHTPVRLTPLKPAWYGFLLSRRKLISGAATESATDGLPPLQGEGRGGDGVKHEPNGDAYWSCSRGPNLWRYELAAHDLPQDWAIAARALLCASDDKVEWIEYFDQAAKRYRAARLTNGQLESCIFIGPDPQLPPREWLAGLFTLDRLDDRTRASLLTGTAPAGQADTGKIVCSCFAVGENAIRGAIAGGCGSVEAIGQRLKAGTNCGSCVPEIRVLLSAEDRAKKIA
jgi:assimilatory nitrate reductase catalytic subunit